jgi:hypothetical protein
MARTMTLNVPKSGALGEFGASNVGPTGKNEQAGEDIGDLVRSDTGREEPEDVERLKAELAHAFAAPDGDYRQLDASEVIRRNARSEGS